MLAFWTAMEQDLDDEVEAHARQSLARGASADSAWRRVWAPMAYQDRSPESTYARHPTRLKAATASTGRSVEPPGQDDDAACEGESDGLSKQEEVLALKDVQSRGRGVRDELKVAHRREDGHEHARLHPILAEDVPERQRGEHEREEERPQGGDGQ